MGDAPDQNEIGDVDSLASTVESDPEAEYLVNDIHAERRFYVCSSLANQVNKCFIVQRPIRHA
jgi:hypothetical protein